MKFRTEIAFLKPPFKINYHHPLLMMGSCFTDNIGDKLKEHLFHTCVNPFGVTYNPFSIDRGLNNLMNKDAYEKDDLGFYNELYFSFDHYTKFSGIDPETVLTNINNRFQQSKKNLKHAGTLILTFGTAYAYKLAKTGQIVNNCHKLPDAEFSRALLTVDEIHTQLSKTIRNLFTINPKIKIILTVSPVRHLKDGFIGNQKSKSTLLLAAGKIEKEFPDQCSYFPSYEIMMDDLRDYRFYSGDMIHPNDQAIDYIWNKFSMSFFGQETHEIIKKVNPLLKSLKHRPLQENTEKYKNFLAQLEENKKKLQNYFPFLNWPEIK